MPPPVSTTREAILDRALDLVRREGLEALTARNLSGKLGCSVAPLYRTWGSMKDLEEAVLRRARELLEARIARCDHRDPFRAVGLGMVLFARDEPQFYRGLFLSPRPKHQEARSFLLSVEGVMEAVPWLGLLTPEARRELLGEMSAYTQGLALLCLSGELEDRSDEALDRRMGRVGWAVIRSFLEDAGIPIPEEGEGT